MIVGIAQVELHLLEKPDNLKARRSVINHLKGHLNNHLPIVVSEVGQQELLHKTILGMVTISPDKQKAEETMQKALSFLEQSYQVEIVNRWLEFESY